MLLLFVLLMELNKAICVFPALFFMTIYPGRFFNFAFMNVKILYGAWSILLALVFRLVSPLFNFLSTQTIYSHSY